MHHRASDAVPLAVENYSTSRLQADPPAAIASTVSLAFKFTLAVKFNLSKLPVAPGGAELAERSSGCGAVVGSYVWPRISSLKLTENRLKAWKSCHRSISKF